MVPGKNGPRKIGPRKDDPQKNGLRKIGPRKNGPRETQKRKIVGWASNIVVCVSNVRMWSFYENPKLDKNPSWTPLVDRDVNVKHLFVCVVELIDNNEEVV